jgi:COP9 signalosome complex subunit 4
MALEAKLNQISRLEVKDQSAQFISLTNELVAGGSTANLNVLAQKVLSEEIPTQVARPVLLHLATSVKSISDEEAANELAVYLVTLIKQSPSASSFDEADFFLRDWLFSYLCGCEEYTEAARYLSGANLESTVRAFTDLEKVDIYIKCAG